MNVATWVKYKFYLPADTKDQRIAELEAANNLAERISRPAVITRKTNGCYTCHSDPGLSDPVAIWQNTNFFGHCRTAPIERTGFTYF